MLISASRSNPRPSGKPTEARPVTIDGPGTGCAFVMCDQEAILCTPDEYWRATVFPNDEALVIVERYSVNRVSYRCLQIFCLQR